MEEIQITWGFSAIKIKIKEIAAGSRVTGMELRSFWQRMGHHVANRRGKRNYMIAMDYCFSE